jgi:protease-4
LAGEVVVSPAAEDEDETDYFGDPLPTATLSDDGTLTIPIQGVIGRKIGMIGRACGGCDLLDVERDLAKANHPAVSRVVLDIDSPGGSVTGVPELASRIKAAADERPVFAFTDGMMCSAAYWLASQADAIYATKSADVGSIGVYMALLDTTRAFEMEGIRTELFKAGRMKAMGLPGTSLSDEDREHLQREVDDIYAWFTSDVLTKRDVNAEVMQGQRT